MTHSLPRKLPAMIPAVLLACATTGCAVVPYGYGPGYGPRVYTEPAVVVGPPIFVAPRPYGYGRPDYGRGGPHWRDREGNDHRR